MNLIAIADDHVLLRKGLVALLENMGYKIILEADNGQQLIEKIATGILPELILMDINMPMKDGYETTLWLKEHHPNIKILALSSYDDETAVIRMLKNGSKGYVLKDCEPTELRAAIESVLSKGFYYSELVTGRLMHTMVNSEPNQHDHPKPYNLTQKEIDFLIYTCSELSYKEIALKMNLSPRTIDGYRDSLFEKLNIKTRTGLVMYTIRNGFIKV